MGQFGLDSSDIISGFDEILKTHSLDFFCCFFISPSIQSLQTGRILFILVYTFKITSIKLYCVDDCPLIDYKT